MGQREEVRKGNKRVENRKTKGTVNKIRKRCVWKEESEDKKGIENGERGESDDRKRSTKGYRGRQG